MRISEASIKLSIPGYYIRYWKKIGLVGRHSTGDLDFSDLLKIRFIQHCRKNRISLQKIRSVMLNLSDRGGLLHETLFISPGILLKKAREGLMEPASGQFHFEFEKNSSPARIFDLKNEPKSIDEISSLEEDYINAMEGNQGPAEIKKILKRILKSRSDHTGALVEMGNISFEENDLDRALEFYNLAVETDPQCVEALYNIANIYFRQNKYAAAIRYFHSCIELDPDFPESYYNLGLVYYTLQYFEKAAATLRIYTELDPDSLWSSQAREFILEIEALENNSRDLFLDQ